MTGPEVSASLVGGIEGVTVSLALLPDEEGKESGPPCGERGGWARGHPKEAVSREVASLGSPASVPCRVGVGAGMGGCDGPKRTDTSVGERKAWNSNG